MIEQILVCITPQQNSKRLINRGVELARLYDADLHILHVIKGNNIFQDKHMAEKLQELFEYGSALGATVHMNCHNDIPKCIGKFIEEMEITRMVLGEPPKELPEKMKYDGNHIKKIMEKLPYPVDVDVVCREGDEVLASDALSWLGT